MPYKPVRLGSSLVWLTVALLAVFPLFAWVARYQHGQWGLIAAAVAGGICWAGGAAALVCAALLNRSSPVAGVLAGMLFRMGLPLAGGVILQQTHAELAAAGIFGTVVLYYLITLVVETTLSIRLLRGAGAASRTA